MAADTTIIILSLRIGFPILVYGEPTSFQRRWGPQGSEARSPASSLFLDQSRQLFFWALCRIIFVSVTSRESSDVSFVGRRLSVTRLQECKNNKLCVTEDVTEGISSVTSYVRNQNRGVTGPVFVGYAFGYI